MRLEEVDVSTYNRRFRVCLDDGASVEAVLYRGDTLCISSQVGCAVACPFCASGKLGLLRHLTLDELWQQVASVQRLGHGIARVTVSGVGEPLHNHRAVAELIQRCRQHRIAPSLTTSGGPIERLRTCLTWPHNGLTLSVHAGTEATRADLVPHGPALEPLFSCLTQALPGLSRSRRKKVALAYLLLSGRNDADDEIDAFIARALPLGLSVHLYAYNLLPGGAFTGVDRASYERIYGRMRTAGLVVRMSSQARIEANGGCGTLVARERPSLRVLGE